MRLERPREFEVEVVGDLTGKGTWTLTPVDGGKVHIRFDWHVIADRPLLRHLTPILRPLFRWNHNWSIQRAIEAWSPTRGGRVGGAQGATQTRRAEAWQSIPGFRERIATGAHWRSERHPYTPAENRVTRGRNARRQIITYNLL